MRTFATAIAATALALSLAACGSPPDEQAAGTEAAAPAPATTAAADAGGKPAAFTQCAACHSTEPGKHGVGPSLAGVFGRKAGTVEGYTYSDANKNSGLTWDEATLDTYLTAPMKMVPGTKMTFVGLADPAQRKAVIDYLKTLK